MTPEDIALIRQVLPEEMTFDYYDDRESPWLLAQVIGSDEPVTKLKAGPVGKLLVRPLVAPVVAACGGRLAQRDLIAVAHAGRALRMDGVGPAGQAGLQAAYARDWHDFRLSFAAWGVGARDRSWVQMSRSGGNLVVQLGFPSDHADLMGRYLRRAARKEFEFAGHPIRTEGRPTLAWARLDIDLASGGALIEEIQSDWLRNVRDELDNRRVATPRDRHLRAAETYEAELRRRYGTIWPRAMLLAVLALLRDEFACRSVWMHQPGPGAMLKGIRWSLPPVSLYSALPKRFCFQPTREWPPFLARPRKRDQMRLRRKEGPLFWRLDF